MGEETVWLTQQQMADLFNKDRTVIGRHIRNIYKEEELKKNITCAKFAHMGTDGDQEYEYTARHPTPQPAVFAYRSQSIPA